MSKKAKIAIKPFRHQVTTDVVKTWAETTLGELTPAFRIFLFKTDWSSIPDYDREGDVFGGLYRRAYKMVLYKYGDMLYQAFSTILEERIALAESTILRSADLSIIDTLIQEEGRVTLGVMASQDVMMYMDRIYVTHNNVPSIYDLYTKLFREKVLRNPRVSDAMRTIVATTQLQHALKLRELLVRFSALDGTPSESATL